MKKIKLIIYHPYSDIGGADNSLNRLLSRLNTDYFSITFVSLNKSFLRHQLKRKVEFVNLDSSRALFSIFKLRTLVKKYQLSKKYSKIIVFSNQHYGNILSFLSNLFLNNIKKIFIDRNHLDELKFDRNIFKKVKNNLIRLLIKISYKHADIVIGISKKLSTDLSKFCNVKVKTIYSPAYDKSIFQKAKKNIKINNQFQYLINVSRFTKRKDHETTINGFNLARKKIKNLKLILIGYGSEYENIKILIKKLKLKKKILIYKKLINPYPFIKRADLLILTSKYEGMGNILVESIALNTPVISSNCNSGPSEILLNGKGGDLFNVSNYQELSKKIIKHFNNKKILKNKNRFAKKNLLRFDANKHVLIYEKIFKNI